MSKCGNCCYGVMAGPNGMFCSAQNCFCEEVFDCEDYEPIVKPITNADRIRAMTDEELAEFCVWMCPPGSNENLTCEPERKLCSQCWLEWLKEEEQS